MSEAAPEQPPPKLTAEQLDLLVDTICSATPNVSSVPLSVQAPGELERARGLSIIRISQEAVRQCANILGKRLKVEIPTGNPEVPMVRVEEILVAIMTQWQTDDDAPKKPNAKPDAETAHRILRNWLRRRSLALQYETKSIPEGARDQDYWPLIEGAIAQVRSLQQKAQHYPLVDLDRKLRSGDPNNPELNMSSLIGATMFTKAQRIKAKGQVPLFTPKIVDAVSAKAEKFLIWMHDAEDFAYERMKTEQAK